MSHALADALRLDANDACEAVLTEIHDPHARQPLRRIVLGPLPANAVSSRTLIDEAQRKGVRLDESVGEAHKGPGGHSGLSQRVFTPPRALRRPPHGLRSRSPPWLELGQPRRPSPDNRHALPSPSAAEPLEAHSAASAERSEGSVIDTSVAGPGTGAPASIRDPGSPRSSAVPDYGWVTEDAPDGSAASHATAPSFSAWYEQESPLPRVPEVPADTRTIIEPLAAGHQPVNPSIPPQRDRFHRGRSTSLYNLSDPDWQPRSRTRSGSISMRRGSHIPAPHSAQHWLDAGLEERLSEEVGVLAGGVRWVGRSFEVGDRLFEVLASTQSGPAHGRLVSGPAGPSSRPRTTAPQRSFTMPEGMYKHDEEPEVPAAPVSAPPRPGMPKRTYSEEAHPQQRPPAHRTFSLPDDEGTSAPASPALRPILRRFRTESPEAISPVSTAAEPAPASVAMARSESTPQSDADAAAREKWRSTYRLLEDLKPVRPAPPPPMTPEQMQAKPPSRRLTFQRGTKLTSETAPSPRPRSETPRWRRLPSPGSTPPRRPRASRPAPLPPTAGETAAAAAASAGEPARGALRTAELDGRAASPTRRRAPGRSASPRREPEADAQSIESIPPVSTAPGAPGSDVATERPSIKSIPPLSKAAEGDASRPRTPRKAASLFPMRASAHRPSSKRQVQFALRPSSRREGEPDVEAEELAAQALAGGESIPVGAGDQAPRPAEEVLSRHAEPPLPSRPLLTQMERDRAARWRSRQRAAPSEPVLKRDRMLVKVQNTANVDLPRMFDQLEARKYDIRSSRWTEYMVALRSDRLELWSEASFRGRILGNVDLLKLRHVVPLTPGYTCLSLYSEVDRLFCLTYERGTFEAQSSENGDEKRGARTGSRRLRFRRTGSNILIFCARNLTLAADWMWVLYRALGGRAPESLYVHILALSMRIRLPVAPVLRERVPTGELEQLPALAQQHPEALTRELRQELERMTQPNLLALVLSVIKQLPNWNALAERMRIMGWQPKLVWRSGPVLNWVDMDVTSEGQPRFWSVLAGQLLATHRNVPVLELRTNMHYPGVVSQPQGPMLAEPAAIEGFVWRLRPVSGLASRVYLSVHNSCLCVSRAVRSYAPDPFATLPGGLVSGMHVRDRDAFLRQYVHTFYERERARCRLQIRNCDGFIDLNEVELVRSVGTGQSVCPSASLINVHKIAQYCGLDLCNTAVHLLREYNGDPTPVVQALGVDTSFGGVGDEGMHEVEDRAAVRRMRQFELVLVNGRCITFECSSAALAQEWCVRLFALARYWRCRRRTDTWTLMNVAGTRPSDVHTGGSGRSASMDDSTKFAVGLLWNWCMLDGCRPVLMSGRLFCRNHRRQAFKRYYFMLITGQLVAFSASHSTRTTTARLNQGILYRRLDSSVSLRDAYIYTGRVADASVENDYAPIGTQRRADPHRSKAETQYPRLYRDGLHTADAREDCTFMLRIRKGFDALSAQQNKFRLRPHKKDPGVEMIPGLSDKAYGFIQFRARTMMERDLWVRAITHEMERMSRIELAREQRVRERGKVP